MRMPRPRGGSAEAILVLCTQFEKNKEDAGVRSQRSQRRGRRSRRSVDRQLVQLGISASTARGGGPCQQLPEGRAGPVLDELAVLRPSHLAEVRVHRGCGLRRLPYLRWLGPGARLADRESHEERGRGGGPPCDHSRSNRAGGRPGSARDLPASGPVRADQDERGRKAWLLRHRQPAVLHVGARGERRPVGHLPARVPDQARGRRRRRALRPQARRGGLGLAVPWQGLRHHGHPPRQHLRNHHLRRDGLGHRAHPLLHRGRRARCPGRARRLRDSLPQGRSAVLRRADAGSHGVQGPIRGVGGHRREGHARRQPPRRHRLVRRNRVRAGGDEEGRREGRVERGHRHVRRQGHVGGGQGAGGRVGRASGEGADELLGTRRGARPWPASSRRGIVNSK